MSWTLFARPALSAPVSTAVLASLALATAMIVDASATANAGLRLCNKTGSQIGVAVGYKNQQGWTTEGWWNLVPNACETLLSGDLVSRYYYIYAVDYDLGGEWAGEVKMCTKDKAFTIYGIENCSARGYDLTGFIEIDTGNERDWTVQLTEPAAQGTGGK